MNMPMRLVNEVPEIYVDQSRDMQLMLRLMDCIYNGVKFDIDSILNLTRTNQVKSNYLELLQSKVGFISNEKFDLDDLRIALDAFPYLIKNKGSKKAIKQAVNAYLKMRHIKTEFKVNIVNSSHSVYIYINGSVGNRTILDEILKYILPTGYEVKYVEYEKPGLDAIKFYHNDEVEYIIPNSGDNQIIRSSDSEETEESNLMQSAGTQTLLTQEEN